MSRDEARDADGAEVEFAAPDSFFEGMEAEERRTLLERALERLPDRQRIPLVLFHFEDYSYEEIARVLGVSLAKVKTDLFRGRTALARILAPGNPAAATAFGGTR